MATYLLVASLIAFLTVKIVGIPIGPKMFTKIVISILALTPLYILVAYLISHFVSRDIKKLEDSLKRLPHVDEVPPTRIREVESLARALKMQSERINSLIESQRLTLYRITHDLGTPLNNIKNVLQAIKEGVIAPEERSYYIDKSLEETEKVIGFLKSGLEGLRKVSRHTEKEKVLLCSLLERIVKMWELRFKKSRRSINLHCSEEVYLEVSPADLEEVLNNLIENAFSHTDSPFVEIKVASSEGGVEIKVINEGYTDSGKLRESYRKGSLGLYIVRELVWKNGGGLDIRNSNRRTEVIISFPCA